MRERCASFVCLLALALSLAACSSTPKKGAGTNEKPLSSSSRKAGFGAAGKFIR